MNKNIAVTIIVVLAVVGALVVTQQAQKAAEEKAMQEKATIEANRLAAEASRALQKAEQAKQKAIAEAKRAEEIARQEAAALQARINGLVAQARTLLNEGKFQASIDLAKNVLSQDADNADAKSILQTAMAKLQEFAQQQAGATLKEEGKKTLKSLSTTLNEAATQ